MSSWKVTELLSRGTSLHLNIRVLCDKEGDSISKPSPRYIIRNAVSFQVRMDTGVVPTQPSSIAPQSRNNCSYNSYSLLCIFEQRRDSDNMYMADVTISSNKQNTRKTFVTHDKKWRLLVEPTTNFNVVFTVVVSLRLIDNVLRPIVLLYQDTKSTDLKLIGKDGTVEVHSTVLIAQSAVLRTKINEIAQESSRPYELALPHVKHSTLQDLQDYIYLNEIPDRPHSALMDLINFASQYKMKELGQCSTQMLYKAANTKNFYELTHFALDNNMMEFLFAILVYIEKGYISTENIRKHVFTENACNRMWSCK